MKTTRILSMFMLLVIFSWSSAGIAFESLWDLDDLFSDDVIVEHSQAVQYDVDRELHAKRIGVTGQIGTFTAYSRSEDTDSIYNAITSDVTCEVRLPDGYRGLLSLELNYYPSGVDLVSMVKVGDDVVPITTTTHADITINEFFLDAHWNRQVYLRTGKQVLKWGRGYFWNPTDMINVEKNDFAALDKTRAGTFGARVHVPFGMTRNLYFFAGLDGIERLAETSLAAKYEFLVGNTEMSISAWNKQNLNPVYGFDISGRVSSVDLRGEVGVSQGYNRTTMDVDTYEFLRSTQWTSRVSLGASKSFDHANISDRISVSTELYYNQDGYEENVFSKLSELDLTDQAQSATYMRYMTEVYEPYQNSKYYLAYFTSVQRFPHPNMTLSVNGITNLVDKSTTFSTGLSYKPSLSDMSVSLSANTYFGRENTEATFHGNRFSISLATRIVF